MYEYDGAGRFNISSEVSMKEGYRTDTWAGVTSLSVATVLLRLY
jgi:hypothetical protein